MGPTHLNALHQEMGYGGQEMCEHRAFSVMHIVRRSSGEGFWKSKQMEEENEVIFVSLGQLLGLTGVTLCILLNN